MLTASSFIAPSGAAAIDSQIFKERGLLRKELTVGVPENPVRPCLRVTLCDLLAAGESVFMSSKLTVQEKISPLGNFF